MSIKPTDKEIAAAAAVIKTNARDESGRPLDDSNARRLAQLVLEAAARERAPATIPAYRADG